MREIGEEKGRSLGVGGVELDKKLRRVESDKLRLGVRTQNLEFRRIERLRFDDGNRVRLQTVEKLVVREQQRTVVNGDFMRIVAVSRKTTQFHRKI